MTSTRPARARIARTLVLAVGALLALAGCMKIDYTATLNPDDTVSWTMIMATSDAAAEQLGMSPQELWDSAGADTMSDLPEGATVEDYAADGYTGVKMTAANQPIATASDPDGGLAFTREGDEYVVTGTMDLSDTSGEIDMDDPATKAMLESFQVHFAVTFPGAVSQQNGELSGTTVTWTPRYGEVTELSARGSAIPDGSAASPSATPSESESESATAEPTDTESSESTGSAKPDTTAAADDEKSDGFPVWLIAVIGVVVLAGVVTAVALVVRQRGAAQRAAAAAATGDLPAWQVPAPGPQGSYAPGPQGSYAPGPQAPTAQYGAVPPAPQAPAPQAPTGYGDAPTAPYGTVPPMPPTPPAPPAHPAQGSTPPPPPPA